jgi:hypothetical protein
MIDFDNVGSDNFGWYMFGCPLLILCLAFALATGLWPILIIIWLLWPKRSF